MSEALRLQEDLQAEQARRFELEKELAAIKADRAAHPGIIAKLKAELKQSRQHAVELANKPPVIIEKPIEKVIEKPIETIIEKPIEVIKYRTKTIKADDAEVDRLRKQAAEAIRLQEDLQAEQQRRHAVEVELQQARQDRANQPAVIQELRDQIKALKDQVIEAGNKPAKVVEKPIDRVVYKDRVVEKPIDRIVYHDRVIEKPIDRVVVVKEKPEPKQDKTGPLKSQITKLKKAQAKAEAEADQCRQAAAKAQAQLAGLQSEINNLTDQLRARNVSSNQ